MHNSNAPMARTTLHLVSYQSLDECSGSEREWGAGANLEGMAGPRRFRRVVDSLVPVAGPWLVAVNLIQMKFEFVYRLVIFGDLGQWAWHENAHWQVDSRLGWRSRHSGNDGLFQQLRRIFDGNGKVRATKIPEHREIYADHFSVAVEKGCTRTAGGRGGVVDNLVLEHVADVALRGRRADEAPGSELRHDAIDVLSVRRDFPSHFRACSGENAFNSGGVANQHDRLSRNCGFVAVVEFEHRRVGRERRFELKSGDIRLRGNAIQFGVQTLRFTGEVNVIGKNEGGGAMIEELLHILVFPPRFDDVVIGDDFSISLHDESGAEDVNLEMRPRTVYIELHHPFVVDQRLASGIKRYPNGTAGLRVEEFDDNVQQADAGAEIVDDGFGDLAFAFQ